jgi:DNA-binding transcriptional MerR regulator
MKLTIKAAAAQVGVTAETLRIWDGLGLLPAERDSVGRRLYSEGDVIAGKAILQERLARRGFGRRLTGDEAA